jgi:1-acyl-sn-glycerol-3-phosphate acyltransferase
MTTTQTPRPVLLRRHSTPGFHRLVRGFARVGIRTLARLDVQGIERVPLEDPFVGVVNHLSSYDPIVVLALMPIRRVTMFAAIEHRNDFIAGWVLDKLGSIWIHRGEPSRDALRIALNELSLGTAFGIAPEGTRSRTGKLLKGKTGAAYLATRAHVPILPVAIWGTEQIKHNLWRFKRTTVHLRVGELFHLPEGRADAGKLQQYTDVLMRRIASMMPPEYRGEYTDTVVG